MTGFDAQFVYDDSPDEPQHTLKLMILDAAASHGYAYEDAVAVLQASVAHVPPLRWRIARVPLDLHHPVCLELPELDVRPHVKRVALPAPGGHRELCEVISDLASLPLDPSRPLWEIWFLEGLEGGRVAVLLKLSHALADGGATVAMLGRAFRTGTAQASGDESRAAGPPPPSRLRLALEGLRDALRDLFLGLPALALRAWRTRRRLRAEGVTVPPAPSLLGGPRGIFHGPLSRRRGFDFVTVPLERARDIRSVFGTTLNDVVLAVAAGAVRRHLDERGVLPPEPLRGNMLVSTRTEGQRDQWGNRVTSPFLWLPTHLADPVERLRAAQRAASDAKRRVELHDGVHLESYLELVPPFVLKGISVAARAVARFTSASGGVIVSNVAGPREPLPAGAGRVENFVSVGHMKFVSGLNITVWSYAGQLNFAIYADRETVPDITRLATCIGLSFEELGKAADRHGARTS